jgi:hypothetical protein
MIRFAAYLVPTGRGRLPAQPTTLLPVPSRRRGTGGVVTLVRTLQIEQNTETIVFEGECRQQ